MDSVSVTKFKCPPIKASKENVRYLAALCENWRWMWILVEYPARLTSIPGLATKINLRTKHLVKRRKKVESWNVARPLSSPAFFVTKDMAASCGRRRITEALGFQFIVTKTSFKGDAAQSPLHRPMWAWLAEEQSSAAAVQRLEKVYCADSASLAYHSGQQVDVQYRVQPSNHPPVELVVTKNPTENQDVNAQSSLIDGQYED
ncbi:hypothetical protein B0H19DRAFT_1084977 [Mycena capillaripes]|nr:hypothetical protein B0H19DRAFT_1084977 [Mycena capillaripes]